MWEWLRRRRLSNDEDRRAVSQMDRFFVGVCVMFVIVVLLMAFFAWRADVVLD
jgi:hypothetical protein